MNVDLHVTGSIQRLQLAPRDILVCTVDQRLTQQQAFEIKSQLEAITTLPPHRVLVIDGGGSLLTLSLDEATAFARQIAETQDEEGGA